MAKKKEDKKDKKDKEKDKKEDKKDDEKDKKPTDKMVVIDYENNTYLAELCKRCLYF